MNLCPTGDTAGQPHIGGQFVKSMKTQIATQLQPLTGLNEQTIVQMLEYPPNPELGDFALPCFKLAKTLRKSPNVIAEELAAQLVDSPIVDNADAAGGYLNIRLHRGTYANALLNQAITHPRDVFSTNRGTGHTAAVDYSSPNIAKPFGVGHLRSTIIGESIVRLLREDGYKVVGVNHLGDWGTQFGKTIAAYLRWGDEATVKADPVKELFKLYVKFHEEAEKDPTLEDEGRYWFKQLEAGNEQAVLLWQWFIDESLKAFKQTYGLLGVSFDHYLGESFYNDKMIAIVDELQSRDLLVQDDGAQVVKLGDDMPPCIIKKSDGTSIYATRDLAAAEYRHTAFGADTLVYVVGSEQKLHFQQLFKVLSLMGRAYAERCHHVAFGMMKYNGERLSTRRGHVVYLEDVLAKAISEAKKIIEDKNPGLQDKDAVARSVGVGAVVFNDLKTYRAHDVDFRFEDVLNFDGETGPYVQYTHARASSVLRKAGINEGNIDISGTQDWTDFEWQLVFQLGQASEALERAVDEYDPSVMARYTLQVCHAFNRFYHHSPILQSEGKKRDKRLAITVATRNILARAMYLIGIDAPSEM